MKIIANMDIGDGVKVQLREINPADAKNLLDGQDKQRPKSTHSHLPLERLMKGGLWLPYVDLIHTLRFSDGAEQMVNGQHRMQAFIDSGLTSLRFLFVVGVAQESMDYIDTGRPRKASDILAISGVLNASNVAAITVAIMRYSSGQTYSRFSAAEIHEFASAHAQEVQHLSAMAKARPDGGESIASVFGSVCIPGALLFFMRQTTGNWESATQFAELVRTGIGLDAGNPILQLRKVLMASKGLSSRSLAKRELSPPMRMALGAKAAAFWIDGEDLFKLQWIESEPWPITDGKITMPTSDTDRNRERRRRIAEAGKK